MARHASTDDRRHDSGRPDVKRLTARRVEAEQWRGSASCEQRWNLTEHFDLSILHLVDVHGLTDHFTVGRVLDVLGEPPCSSPSCTPPGVWLA